MGQLFEQMRQLPKMWTPMQLSDETLHNLFVIGLTRKRSKHLRKLGDEIGILRRLPKIYTSSWEMTFRT